MQETRREGRKTHVVIDGRDIGYVESVGGTWWMFPLWSDSPFRIITGAARKDGAVDQLVREATRAGAIARTS